MVGMAVAAVGPERDDNVRPELADDLGHLIHQGREPGIGEGAVDMLQAARPRDTQTLAGQAQLGLPDSADRVPGTGGGVADLARLAPGRRHHHDLGTLLGVAGERAPGAERLIVRMGEDTQQAAAASRRQAVIERARPRGARLTRVRSARRWLPDQALSARVAHQRVKRPDEGCRIRPPVQLGHLAVHGECGDPLAGRDCPREGPVRRDAAVRSLCVSSVTMLRLRDHGVAPLWRVDIRASGGRLPVIDRVMPWFRHPGLLRRAITGPHSPTRRTEPHVTSPRSGRTRARRAAPCRAPGSRLRPCC